MRAIISNGLRKLATWIERRADADVPPWALAKLRPLTPRYSKKRHGLYLSAIEEALNNSLVRNVALTGSYGVGKSSVLVELTRVHREKAIAVSLSTLGLDTAAAEGAAGKAAATKTNQIQKEIVKQLLYSQDPVKMPGSRFERGSRFRWRSRVFLSLLVGVPVVVLFILTKWSDQLAATANFPKGSFWWMYLIIYAFSVTATLVVTRLVHNRLQLSQVTAGSATISLAPKSTTYFDQYLDEIVYLFEIDHVDLVIFEDIDRFDDAHIFETLRSLNTLLNAAKQLRGRNIRFVYAIKDSIFDELGLRAAAEEAVGEKQDGQQGLVTKKQLDAAVAELARANRTKFFDIVIPMVPFITHLSARDLLLKQMKGTGAKLKDELVDLAGRYLADMRLLKDIRNEFIVFNDRVRTGGSLNLTADGVFAMVLYKTLHLSDFERIRLGESDLDNLYRDFRSLVSTAISDSRKRLGIANRELRNTRPVAVSGKNWGGTLLGDIRESARQLGLNVIRISFSSRNVDDAELVTDKFWTEFSESNQPLTITIGINQFNVTATRTLTHEDVATIVGDPLRSSKWVEDRRKQLTGESESERQAIAFLGHATMEMLAKRDEWSAKVDKIETDFDGLLHKHLKSDLARALVREGFIDRNFTLYTSRYYTDRVSAEATNYIIKNVDLEEIDIYAALTKADVASILRERGTGILREQSAYNINVLDYLLDEDPTNAFVVTDRLARFGEREREVILAYFQAGNSKDKLAAALTKKWSHILVFLVHELAVDPAERLDLVDVALSELADGVTYEIDDQGRVHCGQLQGSPFVHGERRRSQCEGAREVHQPPRTNASGPRAA